MKKRRTAIVLCTILAIVLTFTASAFADGLAVLDSTPKPGETGKQPENMAVKVEFNKNMMDPVAIEKNESLFKIVDPEGKNVPFTLVYSEEKYPEELWIVLNEKLQDKTEYTFTAMAGITAADGSTLPSDYVIDFTTRDTKRDNNISMILMTVMMVFIVFTSSRAAKKAAQNVGKKAAEQQEDRYNPYKLAKEKGISVEEASAIVEKQKAKAERQQEKADAEQQKKDEAFAAEVAAYEAQIREQEEAERRANNFRVKEARSIKDVGGKVPRSVVKANKAKREKAAAEQKARERAKRK